MVQISRKHFPSCIPHTKKKQGLGSKDFRTLTAPPWVLEAKKYNHLALQWAQEVKEALVFDFRYACCNTLKFVLLKIGLKCFIYEFLCTWNIEKRILFIILNFIIRSSNMDVHTCQCIWFIALSGWIQNSKWIQNAFENEFENGFEIKEKKIRK